MSVSKGRLIPAAILAIFVYGMIAALAGTIVPELSNKFQLDPVQADVEKAESLTRGNPSDHVASIRWARAARAGSGLDMISSSSSMVGSLTADAISGDGF